MGTTLNGIVMAACIFVLVLLMDHNDPFKIYLTCHHDQVMMGHVRSVFIPSPGATGAEIYHRFWYTRPFIPEINLVR